MLIFLQRCCSTSMIRSVGCGIGIIRHHQQYKISTTAAKSMLGFSEDKRPSIRELRNAYFAAAKRCHPDIVNQQQRDDGEDHTSSFDFRDVTAAYEHLLNGDQIDYNQDEADSIVTRNEEEEYRDACRAMLGLPAEIVEESKQNPMFRKWLTGNTDGAVHWRSFFAANGGLAQKLRPPAGYLGRGKEDIVRRSETRRKRDKRTTTRSK